MNFLKFGVIFFYDLHTPPSTMYQLIHMQEYCVVLIREPIKKYFKIYNFKIVLVYMYRIIESP